MSVYDGCRDVRYTVYDNRTGFPIIVDGTSREAAQCMGVKLKYFYAATHHSRKGENKRWTILTRRLRDDEFDEEDT